MLACQVSSLVSCDSKKFSDIIQLFSLLEPVSFFIGVGIFLPIFSQPKPCRDIFDLSSKGNIDISIVGPVS